MICRADYLDASALLIGPTGDLVEVIDFSHRWSCRTAVRGAATHSGDTFQDDDTEGVHTIKINLDDLGKQVRILSVPLILNVQYACSM